MLNKAVAETTHTVLETLFSSRYYAEDELAHAGFKNLGSNVRIHQQVNLHGIENITLGSNIRIDAFASIIATGAVTLGSYIHIASHCLLAAAEGILMADFSTLSSGVKIFTRSDDYSGRHMTNPTVPELYTGAQRGAVTLERHVIVGAGSIILPGVTIGEGSAIGALSLVAKSLPPWGIHAGIPAKRLRARSRELLEKEAALLAAQPGNR